MKKPILLPLVMVLSMAAPAFAGSGYELRGRFYLDYFGARQQYFDYGELGSRVRFDLGGVGLPWQFKLDFRNRLEISDGDNGSRNRLYNLYAWYTPISSPFSLRFGRMTSLFLGSSGFLDGVEGFYTLKGPWQYSFGALGGIEPDYSTSEPQPDVRKAALVFDLKRGRIWNMTLSAIGVSSSLPEDFRDRNRAYFYLYNNVFLGRQFSLYQSAEFDVAKRGDHETGLNQLIMNVRGEPWSPVTLTGSYMQNVVGYYQLRILDPGDPLYDPLHPQYFLDHLAYQSASGRISLRPFSMWRFFGGVAWSKQERQSQDSWRYQGGLSTSNLFGSHIRLNASATSGENWSSKYFLWYVIASRSFWDRLDVEFEVGDRTTKYSGLVFSTGTNRSTTAGTTVSYTFPQGIFASGQYEHRFEQNAEEDSFYLSLGYQFRKKWKNEP